VLNRKCSTFKSRTNHSLDVCKHYRMKRTVTKILPILSLLFFSCKSDFGNSFKIMTDLRTEFEFNSVKMSWSEESTTFTLQDIDHNDLSLENLKSYSIKVDKYITNKYPKIDSLENRKYLFSGAGGFEIVEFTIDKNGDLKHTKEY
jgi:hypothetical protein